MTNSEKTFNTNGVKGRVVAEAVETVKTIETENLALKGISLEYKEDIFREIKRVANVNGCNIVTEDSDVPACVYNSTNILCF